VNKHAVPRPPLPLIRLGLLLAVAALLLCACGIRTQPWGSVVVAPGQPILIGIATDVPAGSVANAVAPPDGLDALATGAGMIYGHLVQLRPVPVHCDAASLAAIVATDESIGRLAGVIGPSCSRGCVYAEGILYAARTTMIAPACTAAAVAQQGFPIVFRLAWNDDDQGVLAGRYLSGTLHLRRVTIVRGTSVFSRAQTAAFARSFKSGGGATTEIELSESGATDVSVLLSGLNQSSPDAIFLAVDRPDSAELFTQLAAALPRVPIVGTDVMLGGQQCAPDSAPAATATTPDSRGQPAGSACPVPWAAANSFVTAGLRRSDGSWESELPNPRALDLFRDQDADALQL
jgi:branched-chain amino acid transport system substrate-binding protein